MKSRLLLLRTQIDGILCIDACQIDGSGTTTLRATYCTFGE
jgi:hypothetical protein